MLYGSLSILAGLGLETDTALGCLISLSTQPLMILLLTFSFLNVHMSSGETHPLVAVCDTSNAGGDPPNACGDPRIGAGGDAESTKVKGQFTTCL